MNLVAGSYLGAYQVFEQIGSGGMATEYKARQDGQSQYVAIKVVPAFFAEDAGFRARYQEGMALTRLRHPGMLSVLDYGEGHGAAFLVTEYLGSGSLAQRLGRPLPVEEVVRLLGPVAAALDYAHGRGVLHRDVKPTNILLTPDGRPVLGDFGLANVLDAALRLAETGEWVGTPAYMTPEQAAREPLSPKTDQYSLAVIAYELLTGRAPFTGSTPLEVLMAHLNRPLPSARELNQALSPAVEEALKRGLAKRPLDRFPLATAFVDALGGLEQGVAAPLGRATLVEPVARPTAGSPPSRRAVLAAAVAVPLVLAALLGGFAYARARTIVNPPPITGQAAVTATTSAATTATSPASIVAASTSATAAPCQFLLGFKTIQETIPDKVGGCIANENHNPATGDTLQRTTSGLLVWRKADNWTAFTDGYHSWVNGPNGLQQRLNTQRFTWEANPENLPSAP